MMRMMGVRVARGLAEETEEGSLIILWIFMCSFCDVLKEDREAN